MSRLRLLGLLLLSLACARRPKADPLLAEVTTPLHVTVRTHAERQPCTDQHGVDRVLCWLSPGRKGITYLEIIADADKPATGARIIIEGQVLRDVELRVDATGERVAVRTGPSWVVFFLESGVVLARTTVAMNDLDWASVDPIERHLEEMLTASTGAQHERVMGRLVARGGEPGLVTFLSTQPEDRPEWDARFDTLSSPSQTEVRRRLAEQLDGGLGPWEFFIARPPLQPPDFTERVATQALDLTAEGEAAWVWAQLLRGGHPRAGAIACEAVHRAFLDTLLVDDLNETGAEPLQAITGALAVITLTRSRCDWVTTWAQERLCSAPLSCPVPPAPGEDDAHDEPCTEADVDAGLHQWVELEGLSLGDAGQLDAGSEDPVFDEVQFTTSALFVGALSVQPHQPVLTRRLRTHYSVTTTTSGDLETSCSALRDNRLLASLCALPLSETEFDHRGCHVKIDDEHQRVILRELN